MTPEELKYKESRLREDFKEALEHLDVDGDNNKLSTVKCIKTYGVLWHLVHQLCMAEEKEKETEQVRGGSMTTAQTMNVQATGLQMRSK